MYINFHSIISIYDTLQLIFSTSDRLSTTAVYSSRRSWSETSIVEFDQVREAPQNLDIYEQRPNSKWVVMDIAKLTFYITKRTDRSPRYMLDNPAIVNLAGLYTVNKLAEDKMVAFVGWLCTVNMSTKYFRKEYETFLRIVFTIQR